MRIERRDALQSAMVGGMDEREVMIPAGEVNLPGDLTRPDEAQGLVIFAHGSGSSRKSSRNRFVARELNEARLATLLFDLLTGAEEIAEAHTRHLRFDIDLLSARLGAAIAWAREQEDFKALPIGLFGASTGAAAALIAAAREPERVRTVVSRGGRPDLAGKALAHVRSPVLLIVGQRDEQVLELNKQAAARLGGPYELTIVPRATHLFEEPGALEEVARIAAEWFTMHLRETTDAHG